VLTLIDTITINAVSWTDKLESGATLILDKSVNLDSGKVTLKHTTKPTPFTQFDDVIITIGSVTHTVIVQADKITQISQDIYTHEITLVELTGLLVKYIMADRFFSTKTDGTLYTYEEIVEILQDTVPFGKTNVWNVSSATLSALDIDAPEKKYENTNLLAALTEIFRGAKFVPRLIRIGATNWLSHDKYNSKNNEITLSDLIGWSKEFDANNYATSVRSKVKNAVYDGDLVTAATWFPSESSSVTPRSSTGTYSDAKAQYQFDNSIRRIIIAKITNLNVLTVGIVTADISAYVVSKENWDGLPLGSRVATTLYGEIAQRNTLYYTVDGTIVENMGTEYKESASITHDAMEMVINSWLDNHATYNVSQYDSAQNIEDYAVQYFYQPYVDMDITAERWDNDISKRSTILSNQKDTIIDLGRYASILNDTVNQLANGNYVIQRALTDYTDRFELGDYTSDNYIVIKAGYEYYPSHIIETVELAKDFVTLDGYQMVDRKVRPYAISRSNVKSNFVYTEYIELSSTNRTNTGSLTTQGLKTLLNAFDFLAADDMPIYNAQYFSVSSNQGSSAINMSAIGIGVDGLRFTCNFTNPKLAGNQLASDGYNTVIVPIRYTNENGYMGSASIEFIHDVTITGDDYPLSAYASTTLLEINNKVYYLGTNDILGLTAELLWATDEPDVIHVAPRLSYNNSLVKLLAIAPSISVFKCGATTRYDIYDTVAKETTGSSTAFTINKTTGYFELDSALSTALIGKTWAVGNTTTGELYFTVNYDGTDRHKIYFNNLIEKTDTTIL